MNSSIALRTVALDTAILANWSRDYFSKDTASRARAYAFGKSLTALGLVPLLSWHHVEELLKHKDLEVARTRFRFLQSLQAAAWISSYSADGFPGSVVDILAYEAATAFERPHLDCTEVRDRVRSSLFAFGSGEQAIARLGEGPWEMLAPIFRAREQRSREIVAISRATHFDVSKEKVSTLINGELRNTGDAAKMFAHLQRGLQDQIATRGDQRISDPAAVAGDFMDKVTREGADILQGPIEQRIRFFERFGVYASDLHPEMLMGEVFDLGMFRSQLRMANEMLQQPWMKLIEVVIPARIPSWLIINALRHHGQDLQERKGSDLTDSHLAVLAAYADFTFVDKRTNENFARASRKEATVRSLVRHVDKGGHYFDLPDKLRRGDQAVRGGSSSPTGT